MNTTIKTNLSRSVIFVIALLASALSNAHGGYGGGGYYHGHGGGWGGYGGGYYRGGGWGWGGSGVIVGVPPLGYYGPQYYAPVCETIRVCNQRSCWLQRECN